ncbi:Uncharacterised protein [Klebsiella pneumoniae]|nr:Uncharacterised protein [Klebsiella pneumoniae]
MVIWNWWDYAYPFAFMGLGTMLQEWFGHDSGIAVLIVSFLLGFRLQLRK